MIFTRVKNSRVFSTTFRDTVLHSETFRDLYTPRRKVALLLLLSGELPERLVLPDCGSGEAGAGDGHREHKRFQEVGEPAMHSLDILDRTKTPTFWFRQPLAPETAHHVPQGAVPGRGISGRQANHGGATALNTPTAQHGQMFDGSRTETGTETDGDGDDEWTAGVMRV